MDIFHMSDIIPLIGLPYPPYGRSNYNVPCPCCDDEPHAKHLNINLQKDVFRGPRCGFSGGIFDLYAYYTGIAREEVHDALIARLDVQGSIPKPEHIPVPVVAEVPPTDIASRSDKMCIRDSNYLWQAGMNGRSGGYLVLYQGEKRPSGYKSYCANCGQKNYRLAAGGNCTCGVCGRPTRVNFSQTRCV